MESSSKEPPFRFYLPLPQVNLALLNRTHIARAVAQLVSEGGGEGGLVGSGPGAVADNPHRRSAPPQRTSSNANIASAAEGIVCKWRSCAVAALQHSTTQAA